MTTVVVQSRIKPEVKEKAERVLDAIGLSMGDAIRIFLQQVANTGGLPFVPTAKRPNATTDEALAEFNAGIRHSFTGLQAILDEPDEE